MFEGSGSLAYLKYHHAGGVINWTILWGSSEEMMANEGLSEQKSLRVQTCFPPGNTFIGEAHQNI